LRAVGRHKINLTRRRRAYEFSHGSEESWINTVKMKS
jgi:hypothetical protein